MPIFIRNYNWKQSTEKIHVVVPLKDVQASKLNLFTSEKYVKLNYPPFILELVLNETIRPAKTKCVIKSEEVILEFWKEIPQDWTQLQQNIKWKELVNIKKGLLDEARETTTVEKKDKEKRSSECTHFLREYQMSVNQKEKQMIQSRKDEQKANAMQKVATWKNELKCQLNKTRTNQSKSRTENRDILPKPIPLPRNNAVITFSLTPRLLPTPKRESKTPEEEEWLKKQAEAARASGFVAANLNEEERDPMWLLNKGMTFMRNENYLGAMNAFKLATRISPKMPIPYVKLAEVLLKLKRFPQAIDKATAALELLTPVLPQNKNLRAEAFCIRAEAFLNIGEKSSSMADQKALQSLK